ncbi:serine/threonine protein kinase [Caldimonas thermodepolymerans]|jgi:Putative homoserine kinase type II (protein kinase fold)|uniref:Stress response kinase A n=1 Tax=Caldimonas thermodepolymerans TaxID=215580 RepID=A0A2S5T656_9BURK|nr:serine/threonine protein kinase [Caldimonas thermodepolymerans]PPE70484.1 serine/threonine protein kinase [Caldimonas thermodepolymerans]QPC31151.1 serine/threonine protein kinase [Caldimonas thermodepolymerans]RDH96608.1 Ser/Thr protein kinase RdoA (MazF antagonist) [Caldimonas thermodepolymerans]TCP04793.1 Ser/Thr protein kinase RdoA (MazF antagonist) [Caldimonas thermodepolymerans]UZG47549.1 serine/threonine protein kinase [Caldimonas thermodepolymerans]
MSDPAPLLPPGDADAAHPYARLTPDLVLDALDRAGLPGDGRLLQLNSYENRVFQAFLDSGEAVVIKFYRPDRWSDAQILEEHAFALELAAEEIPVVAPLALPALPAGSTLAEHAGFRFAVYPRRGGRAPELEDPETLEWLGRFLGRLHAVGRRKPFVHRPPLDLQTFGIASRDWLAAHDCVPPDVRPAWDDALARALDLVAQRFDAVPDLVTLRLHGDCHLGNILWTPAGPHFVDLDDARMGPAIQDLWMLLSGDHAAMQRQLADVLAGYEQFASLDRRELQLIEPLRTLRIVHHCAWIARRWSDPAFPPAFPWFGSSSYWSEQVVRLREQVEAMQDTSSEP